MARSPLTLAAAVTSALPGAAVVGTSSLTESAAGRFDSALVRLDDGRRLVVRIPADEQSAGELAAESRALHALTPGVRALLPFRAPEVVGESGSGAARVLVVDFLEGYRVEPAHVPKGAGAATALGSALAAVHALPPSIVRTDGLPVRTPAQVRDEVTRLVDRAAGTGRVPDSLVARWRQALDTDELWRFESAVVLGGATSSAIVLADDGDSIRAVGVLEWGGLSVGDPATDLRWLASAPEAADAVYAGYVDAAPHAPDALLRERARLYAELEFARWLVHGDEQGRTEVVDDAVDLLTALADGVRGESIVPEAAVDVDAALAFVERMPQPAAASVDTSMQTDAYDPESMSLFLAAERDRTAGDADAPDFGLSGLREPEETAPIDLEGWAEIDASEARGGTQDLADARPTRESHESSDRVAAVPAADEEEDLAQEAERASRAALRRWGGGDGATRLG